MLYPTYLDWDPGDDDNLTHKFGLSSGQTIALPDHEIEIEFEVVRGQKGKVGVRAPKGLGIYRHNSLREKGRYVRSLDDPHGIGHLAMTRRCGEWVLICPTRAQCEDHEVQIGVNAFAFGLLEIEKSRITVGIKSPHHYRIQVGHYLIQMVAPRRSLVEMHFFEPCEHSAMVVAEAV